VDGFNSVYFYHEWNEKEEWKKTNKVIERGKRGKIRGKLKLNS
jgi:hypothetical protein